MVQRSHCSHCLRDSSLRNYAREETWESFCPALHTLCLRPSLPAPQRGNRAYEPKGRRLSIWNASHLGGTYISDFLISWWLKFCLPEKAKPIWSFVEDFFWYLRIKVLPSCNLLLAVQISSIISANLLVSLVLGLLTNESFPGLKRVCGCGFECADCLKRVLR